VRVCVFVGNYISAEIGGSHTFESQVFSALSKLASESKHEFLVYDSGSSFFGSPTLTTLSRHSFAQTESREGLNLKSLLFNSSILNRSSVVSNVIGCLREWHEKVKLKALKQSNIDVVLSLSPGYLAVEIPHITVVWDLQHRRQPYFPEVNTAGEWDDREKHYAKLLRRTSVVITGTEVGKLEVRQFYQVPSERIEVLPLPTPQFALDSYEQNDKQLLDKYHLPDNYLFYPAQFWAHKNHVGLLFAIKHLNDQYNLKFPVVFSGSDQGTQSYVKQVARDLDLDDQVYFTNFVPRDDLIALYRNAFALAFMTFFGPDNLPPLEAMALGCPVVASNVPGAEEQLGDAALLFDPKSPEQAAIAIKSLWENPDLRQSLIQRGYKRANQWTTKDYVKGLFAILDDFESIRRCWS